MVGHMRGEQLRQGLRDLVETLPECDTMVEVGSFAGESTEIFAESGKFKKIYAIDPWDEGYLKLIPKKHSHTMRDVRKEFDKRMARFDFIVPMQMTGTEAAILIGDVDFVYIDGLHDYDSVLEDLQVWIPRTKIIAGHDYTNPKPNGVKKAVLETLGQPDKIFKDWSFIFYDIRNGIKQ